MSNVNLQRADSFLAAGKIDEAESILKEHLSLHLDDVLALERLAKVFSLRGDERALKSLRKRINRLASQSDVDSKQDKPLRVLFVQNTPCIRNYKMAQALRSLGHDVTLAYTTKSLSEKYPGLSDTVYTQSLKFSGNRDLWTLSKHFDLVHCHNEPDMLTVAALAGDAPVIHDTHDLISLREEDNPNTRFFEGIANRGAHGRIYTTPYQMEEAAALYDVAGPSLVFYNYASASDLPQTFHPKLSASDGELHFVYEGSISKKRHRDFNKIFVEIAARGAHVHIYPAKWDDDLDVFFKRNPRLHYYPPVSPKQIMEEMTRYDVGIIPWNLESGNRRFLDSTIANKLFEYLAAGMPVAASAIKSYCNYFASNPVGVTFETVDELFEKLPDLQQMIATVDFSKHVYTFEGQIQQIETFYRRILQTHAGKKEHCFEPVARNVSQGSAESQQQAPRTA